MQKILGSLRKAVNDYNMISAGDHIVVGVSGGKDSILLLSAMARFKQFCDIPFTISAVNIDMGFADVSEQEYSALTDYIATLGIPFYRVETNIAEVIFDIRKESSPCSLCSKMRRGALNSKAIEIGANKLALGHHVDDALETLLMSLIYEGRISTFAPVSYMDRMDITMIRPFVYVTESAINSACTRLVLPIVFNPCPKDKHTKRQYMKELIEKIDSDIPRAKAVMIRALINPERNNLWEKPKK